MSAHDDAVLLIQIAQWGTQMGFQRASRVVLSEDFDPQSARADEEEVATVLTFGETIGTLTKRALLDTDLVLDWLWVAGLWDRVGPAAEKAREHFGVPDLFENFEALARQQK